VFLRDNSLKRLKLPSPDFKPMVTRRRPGAAMIWEYRRSNVEIVGLKDEWMSDAMSECPSIYCLAPSATDVKAAAVATCS